MSRDVLSNMAIEAGGKCGLCAADEKTREFLERYGRSDEYAPLTPDPEANYASEIVIAAGDIEPQIAAPHRIDNVAPVGKYAGMPLDQVCIGSCTTWRIGDMWIAACVPDDKKVAAGTWLAAYPASISCKQESALAGDLGGCDRNTHRRWLPYARPAAESVSDGRLRVVMRRRYYPHRTGTSRARWGIIALRSICRRLRPRL